MTTQLPKNLPLLPLRNGVLFPSTVLTLPVGRKRSLELVKTLEVSDIIAVGTQRDRRTSNPGKLGTARSV